MYPANFNYYQAKTVKDALDLLRKNKGARVLAGGHSLLPMMKLRTAAPTALVDIGRIKALSGIRASKTSLKIGATTTHDMIAASKDAKKLCPVLAEAAAQIGDQQVRNRGTIGGSLAHADPAADLPTVMVALEATLTVAGPKGSRTLPADKFFKDLFTTALKPGEMLTAITVPAYGAVKGMGGAYLKHRHPASSYAVVGVCAMLGLVGGKIARVSLVVGGATATPVHCAAAEKMLMGQTPDEANFAAAAEKVPEAIKNPMSDLYASGEYRTHLAKVMAKRALMSAAERAKG